MSRQCEACVPTGFNARARFAHDVASSQHSALSYLDAAISSTKSFCSQTLSLSTLFDFLRSHTFQHGVEEQVQDIRAKDKDEGEDGKDHDAHRQEVNSIEPCSSSRSTFKRRSSTHLEHCSRTSTRDIQPCLHAARRSIVPIRSTGSPRATLCLSPLLL